MEKIDQKILEEVKNKAKDGKLPCAVALKLAEEKKISPLLVGEAANQLEIKIVSCSLGCFK